MVAILRVGFGYTIRVMMVLLEPCSRELHGFRNQFIMQPYASHCLHFFTFFDIRER